MGKAATLSVIILTFNEEHNIADCLESVRWADEVIVVDSESTDRTVEIAQQYTPHVFIQPWLGYSGQRNFGLSKASGDWVFFLDADERVTPELRDSIQEVLQHSDVYNAYSVVNENYFMNRFLKSFRETHTRLFRNGTVQYVGDVHEAPVFEGEVGKLRGVILHYSYRNLELYVQKLVKYAGLSAQQRSRQGRKSSSLDLVFRPFFDFVKHYIIKGGFLDGTPGFVFSMTHAYYTFLKYAILYERTATSIMKYHNSARVHTN